MPEFTVTQDPIEVSSNHRPDVNWKYVDSNGHLHSWWTGRQPATTYRPLNKYTLPTLRWIVDGIGRYDDGSTYEYGHYECSICGEEVEPRYTGDTYSHYVPGVVRYYIDGSLVSKQEFDLALGEAYPGL